LTGTAVSTGRSTGRTRQGSSASGRDHPGCRERLS
jgi:hypothetical protein